MVLPTRIRAQSASCMGRAMEGGGPCLETLEPAPEELADTVIDRAGRQKPKLGTELRSPRVRLPGSWLSESLLPWR